MMLFLVVVGTVSAQAPVVRQRMSKTHKKMLQKGSKPFKVMNNRGATRGIEVGDGQMWFGYVDDENIYGIGLSNNCDYHLAAYIPCKKIAGKGATIDGVSFVLRSTKAKNVTAWVSTKLPEPGSYETYAKGADLEYKEVDASTLSQTDYNEVAFSKSYEIPEGGLYVGFSFVIEGMPEEPDDSDISDEDYYGWWYEEVYYPWLMENYNDAMPLYASDNIEQKDGTMLLASNYYDDLYREYGYQSYVGWEDYSDYYCLALKALIGGDKFLKNAVSVKDLGEKYVLTNSDVEFPLTLTNSGKNSVENFTYEVAINGEKVAEKTITLANPITSILASATETVSFNVGETSGAKNIELTVTKVNGEVNELDAKAKGTIFALSESAQVKPLVEEYTGTWCGWCPRGWVGLEKIANDFEGRAITVAVHNGDPMEIDEYEPVIASYVEGFPSMLINRVGNVDPYYGSGFEAYGVKKEVEAAVQGFSPAAISVKAQWADAEQTKIKIDTESKIMFDEAEPSFAIGYILVADGLKGTGRDWAQANYYSGDAGNAYGDEELMKLVEMDAYILDMEYNHVAVAAWGATNGVEGSLVGQVKAGVPMASTFEADLNGLLIGTDRRSSDPQDHVTVIDLIKEKPLRVVAFLINKTTGEVVNADETAIGDYDETGIRVVNGKTSVEMLRYNATGQRITAPQKGVNIIKQSNGKTVKVLVK